MGLLSIVGIGVGIIGGSKARKRQRRINNANAARERVKQFRESRLAQGQIAQAGVNSGAGLQSSSVISGTEGAVQQARGNIGFVDQINLLTQRRNAAMKYVQIGQALVQADQALKGK